MIKKNRVQKLMLILVLLAPNAAMAINVAWMGPRSLEQYSPEEREAYEWHLEQARQKRRQELEAQRQAQLQARDQLVKRLRADRLEREAAPSVGSAPKKNSKVRHWVFV